MFVNNCWHNSQRDCALKFLGRFSFQPLSENPLLGPSASALDKMGALQGRYFTNHHAIGRLIMSPWLHSGVVHLIVNLSSIVFVGIHLAQEFGPFRTGVIYLVSALTGSMVAALFLRDRPSVASSGALFGLLGAMLSDLLRNWKLYTKKLATLVAFTLIVSVNLLLGLLPYVDNFSNLGGFLSGFLLGFVLLFSPQLQKMAPNKGDLFVYAPKSSDKLRQKLDMPLLRSISLVLFSLLLVGVIVAVFHNINVNKYCSWCQYVDCVPFKWWSCSDKPTQCETIKEMARLTITCTGTDKFREFPFTTISDSRMEELCNLICSQV